MLLFLYKHSLAIELLELRVVLHEEVHLIEFVMSPQSDTLCNQQEHSPNPNFRINIFVFNFIRVFVEEIFGNLFTLNSLPSLVFTYNPASGSGLVVGLFSFPS
jgi:hypothetical protein